MADQLEYWSKLYKTLLGKRVSKSVMQANSRIMRQRINEEEAERRAKLVYEAITSKPNMTEEEMIAAIQKVEASLTD